MCKSSAASREQQRRERLTVARATRGQVRPARSRGRDAATGHVLGAPRSSCVRPLPALPFSRRFQSVAPSADQGFLSRVRGCPVRLLPVCDADGCVSSGQRLSRGLSDARRLLGRPKKAVREESHAVVYICRSALLRQTGQRVRDRPRGSGARA